MTEATYSLNDPTIRQARARRRAELRRARINASGRTLVLDNDDLAACASPDDVSARGNVVKRAVIVRGLLASGLAPETIAAAWSTTPAAIDALGARDLVDKTGAAAAIDAQVQRELPDLPAPDVIVTPHGAYASPPGVELHRRIPS